MSENSITIDKELEQDQELSLLECKCKGLCEVCTCKLKGKEYIKDQKGTPLWIPDENGVYLNKFYDANFPELGGVTQKGFEEIQKSQFLGDLYKN